MGKGSAWRAEAPPQSVEYPAGSIRVTLMPKPATSAARDWVRPSSAHFDAWYMPMLGKALMPSMDVTWRMWPDPWARRKGRAAWVTHNAPNRLVSICSRASASDSSSTMPNWP